MCFYRQRFGNRYRRVVSMERFSPDLRYPNLENQRNIYEQRNMSNVKCKTADNVYDLKGDIRNPITDVIIKNVSVNKMRKFYNRVLNVRNLKEENVTYNEIETIP